jgi:hypothetical protein
MDAYKDTLSNKILKQADRQQGDQHFITIFLAHVQVHFSRIGDEIYIAYWCRVAKIRQNPYS